MSQQSPSSYTDSNGTANQKKNTLKQWINMHDRTDLNTVAIHLAAFNGETELINLFYANGADINVVTSSGVSALHMASQGN